MKKKRQQLFVVRKYIFATSAAEAIKLDKTHDVDDVWVDDDYRKEALRSQLQEPMGFTDKK